MQSVRDLNSELFRYLEANVAKQRNRSAFLGETEDVGQVAVVADATVTHRPSKTFFANHPLLRLGKYQGVKIPLQRYGLSRSHLSAGISLLQASSAGIKNGSSNQRADDIPAEFDWRSKVDSRGRSFTTPVRDQASCGSCYAFCTCTMLAQRIAIITDGEIRPILSPQDMVTCGSLFIRSAFGNPEYRKTVQQLIVKGLMAEADWYALEGCEGGLLVSALDYAMIYGLPEESEVQYVSGNTGRSGDQNYCLNQRETTRRYYGERTHALTEWREAGLPAQDVKLTTDVLRRNIINMQRAVMTDGPIITSMNIFTDFLYYPSAEQIYTRKQMIVHGGKEEKVKYEGGHAVVILGWGESTAADGKSVPYWICENSWGRDWGLQGYFKIERGRNLCNIEYDAYGLFPSLTGQPVTSPPPPAPVSSSNNSWWIILIVIAVFIVLVVVITVAVIYGSKS